jgi:hypothetical protein
MREQRDRLEREYDYDNDPYFYAPWSYRYSRDGRDYETNWWGARALRRAVQFGYDEGFRTGQADREDGWRASYRDSYAYQDGDYGYDGCYVDPDEYRYYFREGFRRGYDDGYQSAQQYGNYTDGKYTILAEVLSSILGLQQR